jgi:uncharacterized protein
LRQRLLRHGFTASEGEFAALSRHEAARRLREGWKWAHRHALPLDGFVAPAWLLSDAAWQALEASRFDHVCTHGRVVHLPSRAALRMPGLMFSTRNSVRRVLSVLRNAGVASLSRDAPLVRLDLHPNDADHTGVLRSWTRWLAHVLHERQPVRLADAARSLA